MKTIPVSSLLAGMLLPVVCHAQPTPPEGGPDGPGRGRPQPIERGPNPFHKAWDEADQNHDGKISKEEFKAIPRVRKLPEEKQDKIFSRLDKDADGAVSREEMGGFGRSRDDKPMRRLWELDIDHSGGISLDEFKQGQLFKKLPPGKMKELFHRLDTDRDHLITPRDRPEPPPNRGGKGKNAKKGGMKGPKEGGEHARLGRIIEVLDSDGDGVLTFEEFRVGPAAKDLSEDEQEDLFEKLDRNHDKAISPADLPPARPKKMD